MTGRTTYECRMLSKQWNGYGSSFDVTNPPPYLFPDFYGSPPFSGRDHERRNSDSEQQKVSKSRKTAEPLGTL